MKTLRILAPVLAIGLLAAASAPADSPRAQATLASQHLSAIVLIQRFAQAIYRFLPPVDNGCPETDTGFIDNGDGTFTRTLTTRDCSKVVITNFGGSPSDYDIDTTLSDGIRERLQVRTVELFNGGPGKVSFRHEFSTGDRVEYEQELRQEPADFGGGPEPGLNFFYGLISQGRVTLRSGQCMDFDLRQTKAFDCFNFFNGTEIPPEECEEWFTVDPEFGLIVPRPDRLHVEFACSGFNGTMDLEIPSADPFAGLPDFFRPTTGTLVLGGREMGVTLFTDNPELPGWKFWQTHGSGFEGSFALGEGFSGRGQVFRPGSRVGPAARRRPKLQFAARWNRLGIGTVILGSGQTRPGGPTTGALDFGTLKWSGLASAFGPTPGF